MRMLMALMLVFSLVACKEQTTEQKPERVQEIEASSTAVSTQIKGKIENYDSQYSSTTIDVYASDFFTGQGRQESISIDQDGVFLIELDLFAAQEIALRYKQPFTVLLEPGDGLNVVIKDTNQANFNIYKSLSFSGDNALTNTQLSNYVKNISFSRSDFTEHIKTDFPSEFIEYTEKLTSKNQKEIDDFKNKNEITPLLNVWFAAEQKVSTPIKLISYFSYHKPLDNQMVFPDEFKSDFNNLQEFNYSDAMNISVSDLFIPQMNYYLETMIIERQPVFDNKILNTLLFQEITTEYTDNEPLSHLLLKGFYNTQFKDKDLLHFDQHKALVELELEGTPIAPMLAYQYQKLQKLIENPKLPGEAKITAFRSENSHDFLNEIIAEANGKVIYIDNWASWCAPCKVEFERATPTLYDEFKDDVEFVYLCWQSPESAWKSTISEYKLKGSHYYIPQGSAQHFKDTLSLTSFPTYTILDKKGNIVKSENSYKPSNPETKALLNQLIN